MNRRFGFVLPCLVILVGCVETPVDCSPLSEENQRQYVLYLAGQPYTGPCPPLMGPGYNPAAIGNDGHDGGASAGEADACVGCAQSYCGDQTSACFTASGPCSAPDATYSALTTCITDHCAEQCLAAP